MDPALILLAGLAVILLLQFSRVSRQRREVRETQSALAVGRRVLTAAGMIGNDANPYAVTRSLERVSGERRVVVFIDEFDRLASDDARLLFADTIIFPTAVDLRIYRLGAALAGIVSLLYGFIWEAE